MHKSYRGKNVDMDALFLQNQDAVAVGNAKLNARGDVLGKGGKIVKTRESILQEYYQGAPNAVKRVDMSKVEEEIKRKPIAETVSEDIEMEDDTVAKKSKTKK